MCEGCSCFSQEKEEVILSPEDLLTKNNNGSDKKNKNECDGCCIGTNIEENASISLGQSKEEENKEQDKGNNLMENKNIKISNDNNEKTTQLEQEKRLRHLLKRKKNKEQKAFEGDFDFLFPKYNILSMVSKLNCDENKYKTTKKKRTILQYPFFDIISKMTDNKECYDFIKLNGDFFEGKQKIEIENYESLSNVKQVYNFYGKDDGLKEMLLGLENKENLTNIQKACDLLKSNIYEGELIGKRGSSDKNYDIKTSADKDKLFEKVKGFYSLLKLIIVECDDKEEEAKNKFINFIDFFKNLLTVQNNINNEQCNENKKKPYDVGYYSDELEEDDFNYNKLTNNKKKQNEKFDKMINDNISDMKNEDNRYILLETDEGSIGIVLRKENDKIYAIICNHSENEKIKNIKDLLSNCKYIHKIFNLAKIQNDGEHCSVLSSIFFDEIHNFFQNNKNKEFCSVESKKIISDSLNGSNVVQFTDEETKQSFPNLYQYRQTNVKNSSDIENKHKYFPLQTDTYNILTDDNGDYKVYNFGLFRAGWEQAIDIINDHLDDTPLCVLQIFIDVFEKQCKLFDEKINKQVNQQNKEQELKNVCTNEEYFYQNVEIKNKIDKIKQEIEIRDKQKRTNNKAEQKFCDKMFDFLLVISLIDNRTIFISPYHYYYIDKYKDYFGKMLHDSARKLLPTVDDDIDKLNAKNNISIADNMSLKFKEAQTNIIKNKSSKKDINALIKTQQNTKNNSLFITNNFNKNNKTALFNSNNYDKMIEFFS